MSEYERLKQVYEEMKKAPAEALRKENEALKAELHRWQHGGQVEGDYVCNTAAENEQLRARVKELEQGRGLLQIVAERDALAARLAQTEDYERIACENRDEWLERCMAAEAKLSVAVEALTRITDHMMAPETEAREALAKLGAMP